MRVARRGRLIPLVDLVAGRRPDIDDPAAAIADLSVQVDGTIATNPRALVRADASITVKADQAPRGREKLGHALDRLGIAVDVGHGQLLGSLRADPRVVNLERTNVADLDAVLVPAPLDVVVVDVSRLALGEAVAQLTERVTLRSGATLLGLVKPMFELRLGELPTDQTELDDACDRAARAVGQAGWTVLDVIESAVRGSRGAVEFFVHATWTGDA